ncbi:MAG: MmcQ/YjbR family DNA-binding protein, partial [Rhodobacteraceae bacterium]|nr:MmcQ/YjbR family DNA-binding protein [Paracoccaceae bacterium]
MTRDEINTLCRSLPGSEVSDPWGGGHDVWKVGGKSYAIMGTQNEGVTLKCADSGTAQMLIEVG